MGSIEIRTIDDLAKVFVGMQDRWPFDLKKYHGENGKILHLTKPAFCASLVVREGWTVVRLLALLKDSVLRDQDVNIRTANSLSSRYPALNIWSDGEGVYIRKEVFLSDHNLTDSGVAEMSAFMLLIGEIRDMYYYVWTNHDKFNHNAVVGGEELPLFEHVFETEDKNGYSVAVNYTMNGWPKLLRRLAPDVADMLDKIRDEGAD